MLELDPLGRARTNKFVAAPRNMGLMAHQETWKLPHDPRVCSATRIEWLGEPCGILTNI